MNVTLNLSVIAFFNPFPVVHMRRSCLASLLVQSSTKVLRFVHCFLQDADSVDLVPPPPPQPGHFCVDGGRNDLSYPILSSWTSTFFLGGWGVGGGEYLSFLLRLDMASSIFPNIFSQDCRLSYGTNCFDYHFHYKNIPWLSVNVASAYYQIEITIFCPLSKTKSLNK